jgi:predicted nicotinamide N-methyase
MSRPDEPTVLSTTAGDFPLGECRVAVGGRTWCVLHAGAVFTREDEARFLAGEAAGRPYGVALWPSAVALAHEVALRAAEFAGRSVLELGAGTGLPGIVAVSLGARVVQTDRQEVALHLCRLNGQRNGASAAEHRLADWTEWAEAGRHDWLLGADVLYGDSLHPHLRRIFETNLAPGGRVLLADPFREVSFRLLEALQADGWAVTLNKWTVGENARPVGVFELVPPAAQPRGGA